jgi:hypothetical protein
VPEEVRDAAQGGDETLDGISMEELGKPQGLKKLWKVAKVVAVIMGAPATLYGAFEGVGKVGAVYHQIDQYEVEIRDLQLENKGLRDDLGKIVESIRAKADQDRDVLTSLRIAVSALQSANAVRFGQPYDREAVYRNAGAASPAPPPTERRNARVTPRTEHIRAMNDVRGAVEDAVKRQASSDPLAGLEGL